MIQKSASSHGVVLSCVWGGLENEILFGEADQQYLCGQCVGVASQDPHRGGEEVNNAGGFLAVDFFEVGADRV